MSWTWTGWEAETDLGNPDDREGVHYLTIAQDGEEVAVIIHRTCDGKHPLDGSLAKQKEANAQFIVEALNERSRMLDAELKIATILTLPRDLSEKERTERIIELLTEESA